MSDKEFDKLFQQRLESLEVQPSAAVWKGIERELGLRKEGKRQKYFLWSAAASVAIAIAAAIWFTPEQEKVWLQKEEAMVESVKVDKLVPITDKAVESPGVEKKPARFADNVKQTQTVEVTKPEAIEVLLQGTQSAGEDPQVAVEEIPRAYALGTESVTAVGAIEVEDQLPDESLVLAAAEQNVPQLTRKDREVKSIGDLVNFVVGKVDKRQDKLIQFKDSDEGSFITGLNLGIVKIKSRN